jgi:hypothetical protein
MGFEFQLHYPSGRDITAIRTSTLSNKGDLMVWRYQNFARPPAGFF